MNKLNPTKSIAETVATFLRVPSIDFLLPYSFPELLPEAPPIPIQIPPSFGFMSRILPTKIAPMIRSTMISVVFIICCSEIR